MLLKFPLLRLLIVLALIVTALPIGAAVTPVEASGNLIVNGGFEIGKPAPWTGITKTNIVSAHHNGKYSAKITTGEAQQLWIPVTPGATYQLSAWFKWKTFSGSSWGYDRIRVVNYDWTEAGSISRMHERVPQASWQKVSLAFTPTSDKIAVSFGLFGSQDSVLMFFDDFNLQQVSSTSTLQPTGVPTTVPTTPLNGTPTAVPTTPPILSQTAVPTTHPNLTPTSVPSTASNPTPTAVPTITPNPIVAIGSNPILLAGEMLQNAGFESGTAPWTGMQTSQSATWDYHSGQRSAQFIADGEIQQGPIAVTPGKTYTLSAWFKWMEFKGADWGYDRMRVVDANWNTVAEIDKMHTKVARDTWQKLALSFTPHSDKVILTFGMFGPQAGVNFFFDDVSLQEGDTNQPPQVQVAASSTGGAAPQTVAFNVTASDPDGAIARYQWDFGDGSADSATNPTHTFMNVGKFVVKCTVWDISNRSTSAFWTVTVSGDGIGMTTTSGSSSVKITSPSSSGTFTTSNSAVVLSGTADNAASVSWDNLNTDVAGVMTGAGMSSWQTPDIHLKPGKNEILITAMNNSGAPATARLIVTRQVSGPALSNIKLSSTSVNPFDQVAITFDLSTVAEDYLFRYDTNPPPGVKPGIGVTVEGVFTSPSGKTLVQPGFYITDVIHTGASGFGHYEQTNCSYWAVRFSPQETGSYSVSIRVKDASGSTESSAGSFRAGSPGKPGYIRVSKSDTRYFEFSNGSLFWPNGPAEGPSYNQYKGTGMNMQRQWMAGLGAYSTNFARWMSSSKNPGNEGFDSMLNWREHYPGHDLSQEISIPGAQRLWIGWLAGENYRPTLKANTTYLVRARIKTTGLSGPVDLNSPYGFMIKTGNWPSNNAEADMRSLPSWIPPVNKNSDWFEVVSQFTTTSSMPLGPYLFMFLDNVSSGHVYIDEISIRQLNSNGSLGGEQVVDSRADLHDYVNQMGAAAIDYQVQQAEQNGVYLKYVVHDKRDWIQNHLTSQGSFADQGNGYYQSAGTRAHWLLEQWWRYVAARWGYSTAIHTWELNNEGSPTDTQHWKLAEDFGKYMHSIDAHPHLVTTSFWSGWVPQFWGDKTDYPDIDYADIHEYVQDKNIAYDVVDYETNDAAKVLSANIGKPVMRGEVGLGDPNASFFGYLKQPNTGDWFHDLTWSGLAPGALTNPEYWWGEHRGQIPITTISKAFHLFMKGMDLNRGGYVDASAVVSNGNIAAIGQKNTGANEAHLWIQNKAHTWRNLMKVDGPSAINSQSGSITIKMNANTSYTVEWWNTDNGAITRTDTIGSDGSGNLHLNVSNLSADVAVKIHQ